MLRLIRVRWMAARAFWAARYHLDSGPEIVVGHAPFVLAVLLHGITVALDHAGDAQKPAFVAASLLTVVATVVGCALPWHRLPHHWLAVVPLIDIVAAGLFRTAALTSSDDIVGFFMLIPAVWLAVKFTHRWALTGYAGLALAVFLPVAVTDHWPRSFVTWASLLAMPSLLILFAMALRSAINRTRAKQESLTAVSTQLETVLNSVDASIVFYDRSGQTVLENSAARAITALTEATTADANDHAPLVYYPDRKTLVPRDDQIAGRALAGELLPERVYWIGPPGNQRAVVASASTVPGASPTGASIDGGTVVITYDVTTLVEAIRVRDEFLATTSHELRTPLTSILGYLELIDAAALGIDAEISIIDRNAHRLLAMITNLLDAGREPTIHRSPVDVSAVVRGAIEDATIRATGAGVTLSIAPREEAIVADIDSVAIARVLENLLTNAIKFTPSGGSVTVNVGTDDADVTISVVDTGAGISEKDQAFVFDRFFRTVSAQVGAVPGTGLGLSIARSLMDAHDGTISVQSTLGSGTAMTVRFPRRMYTLAHG